ncbi:MAG: MBL fold metallo-hydrolase [Lawsonibacter sp.]|nr:MBL fold metallo-hydrolase [Lawsonibacter sp.]
MKLTWNGHSCFTLEAEEGTLVLDPYGDGQVPGLAPLRLTADMVLCSHEHRDHSAREVVTLTGRTPAFGVETISTYHSGEQGALRGENTIHIITAEGMRLAHLGDLGCELTAQQKDRLHRVDVLMLPVGGYCTISAHEARTLATPLFPRIIIPMHYRSATSGYRFGYDELGLLGNFTAVCPRESLVYYKGSTMEITKHTPGQTAILTYCPG